MVTPLKDGSFRSDRFGRRRYWIDDLAVQTPAPVAPDDTPTRLLEIRRQLYEKIKWHVGSVAGDGSLCNGAIEEIRTAVNRALEHLSARAEAAEADVSRLQQENALLRRSLEMLTKQLDEKDAELTDLRFTIIRHNSPA
jgi:hypothetical protein